MEKTIFAYALLAIGLVVAASMLIGALKGSDNEMKIDFEKLKKQERDK